jgi:hypothetical protein
MPDAAASTASRPAFVTIARAPLCVGRDGEGYKLICGFGKPEFFYKKGWTEPSGSAPLICPSGNQIESVQQIRRCAQNPAKSGVASSISCSRIARFALSGLVADRFPIFDRGIVSSQISSFGCI